MSKKLYLKNNIRSGYFKKVLYSKNKKKLKKIINNILISLDNKKDVFHSLSKNFNFNFKYSSLVKFKKYKSVVIIGMGGSILGSTGGQISDCLNLLGICIVFVSFYS